MHGQLTQMLGLPDADGSSVGATVQMLRILGVGAPTMRKHFTAGRTAAITAVLDSCSAQAERLAAADANQAPVQLQALVAGLSSKLLPMLSQVRRHYCCLSFLRACGASFGHAGLSRPRFVHAQTAAPVPCLLCDVQTLRAALQAVTVYTEAFGSAASGSSAAAPLAALVQAATSGYLAVLRQAVVAHCKAAAIRSCPVHCAAGASAAQQTWEQQGAQGFVRGDFGTGELVATLLQLRDDARQHADATAEFPMLPAIDELIRGSIRCVPYVLHPQNAQQGLQTSPLR